MAGLYESVRRGEAPLGLWWSVIAGPFAWALDLGFSYTLAQHSCSTGHHYVLHVITGVCFVIALSGFVLGFAEFQRFPQQATEEGGRPLDRAYFMAILGILFSLSFAVVVIAGAVPRWILSPCE